MSLGEIVSSTVRAINKVGGVVPAITLDETRRT